MPNENSAQEIGGFFDYLWGTQDGYVYLPTKDPKTSEWKKVVFAWPKARERVILHTLATSAEGKDVYCAPVVFKDGTSVHKENVKGSYVLWADFDGNAPREWSPETSIEPQDGPQTPQAPPPTLRIQSSVEGHEHVYWRLDEFTTDTNFIEDTNRALAYTYKADTSGWDVNQVLRPPGTTNYKHNLPVSVTQETREASYSRNNFSKLKPVKQLVSESLNVDEAPDVTWVVSKYSWDEEHYELFMQKSIPEGKRSSALMKIGFFGAESGMKDAEIYSLLINADDRWGKFKHRSDRQKRLLDIINKARQKHPTGLMTGEGLLRSADVKIATDLKYLYGFQEFLDSEIEIEWAFENLLDVGGIGLLSAQPGVGKTQMSIQLGICAALGVPFLKWKPVRKMKVVLFSLEMGHATLKHFIGQIANEYSEADRQVLERNFKVVPLGESLPFDKPEGKAFIEKVLDEVKPDGIIIDSMGKVSTSSLNDEEKIKQLNQYYGQLRNKYGLFLWFIHHNRKPNGDNKKPDQLGDLYGSQYISAEVTVALNLWKYKDGKLELSELKNRLAMEEHPFQVKRNKNLTFSLVAEPIDPEVASNLANKVEKEAGGDDTSRDLFGF